jgi:hypothetical protein
VLRGRVGSGEPEIVFPGGLEAADELFLCGIAARFDLGDLSDLGLRKRAWHRALKYGLTLTFIKHALWWVSRQQKPLDRQLCTVRGLMRVRGIEERKTALGAPRRLVSER